MDIKPCYNCSRFNECKEDVKLHLDKLVDYRIGNLIIFGEDCFEEINKN